MKKVFNTLGIGLIVALLAGCTSGNSRYPMVDTSAYTSNKTKSTDQLEKEVKSAVRIFNGDKFYSEVNRFQNQKDGPVELEIKIYIKESPQSEKEDFFTYLFRNGKFTIGQDQQIEKFFEKFNSFLETVQTIDQDYENYRLRLDIVGSADTIGKGNRRGNIKYKSEFGDIFTYTVKGEKHTLKKGEGITNDGLACLRAHAFYKRASSYYGSHKLYKNADIDIICGSQRSNSPKPSKRYAKLYLSLVKVK